MINEEQINTLLTKIEERKTTHPNLMTVWEHYFKLKIKSLDSCYTYCNQLLNDIDEGNQDDPSPETLVTMTLLALAMR